MKHIIFLSCIGSLALALTAFGAPKSKGGHRSVRAGGGHSAHVVSRGGGGHAARAQHTRSAHNLRVAHARNRQRNVARANNLRANHREATLRNQRRAENLRVAHARNRERNVARANNLRANHREATLRNQRRAENLRVAHARNHERNVAQANALRANRNNNMTLGRNAAVTRNRQNVRVVNNWHNERFHGSRYAPFYNYNRQWHDRGWWTNHYSNIVFGLGGWWYWNAGYWYPAWGYGSGAYYLYDGPIYGYGNLTPDRIVVNVQAALQRDGYYTGAIDGDIGPQTREALAAFQADNGLAVTSAVDAPTLQTLGLS